MELFLIRHAIAADPPPGGTDAQRPLTPEGVERFRAVVDGLGVLGVELGAVLCSPLIRARQTADLLRPLCPADPIETDLLAAAPGPSLVEEAAGTGASSVALVGHEPWMSGLAGLCLSGSSHGVPGLAFRRAAWPGWREHRPRAASASSRGCRPG